MLLGIDHLVIAVRDPDAAAAMAREDIGLAFTGGGRHEAWGTFNRLAFLGDTYLELIGVFDRDRAASSRGSAVARSALAILDEGREGLATFALATDDIEADVARLQAGGSPIAGPVEGSRARSDGEVVRWRTATASPGPADPPFLIEHELAGAEWGPAARAARASFTHPVGGRVRLARLELPSPDPDATAAQASSVGLVFRTAADGGLEASVGSQVVRLSGDGRREPTVDLVGDVAGSPRELVQFGIRWRWAA